VSYARSVTDAALTLERILIRHERHCEIMYLLPIDDFRVSGNVPEDAFSPGCHRTNGQQSWTKHRMSMLCFIRHFH
jgi:hypothetical protein